MGGGKETRRRVGFVGTDVSVERNTSIFRVESRAACGVKNYRALYRGPHS
jgi:hypothetical protein